MLIHALTVDLEEWYHGLPIAASTKQQCERRLSRGLDSLLGLLDSRQIKATFFVLGTVAAEYPAIVRSLHRAGHEIGCHGWSHNSILEMDRKQFRNETVQALETISETIGQRPRGYRAAYFSIRERNLWALDILAALGFSYDSSIFPVRNWRYGISNFPPHPQRIQTLSGTILEIPISVRRMFAGHIPVSGGAYLRIYPLWLSLANFRAAELAGEPVVFYLHPWELDPGHPSIRCCWKAHITHYACLESTERKLAALTSSFCFSTLSRVFAARAC